ncbi:hypothetical protein T12_11259 [Trichinella patagoniensis]|uniref:Uncharacterized protein n=1 Tax=Trichinella patagoniensis TaxID=990121 RepID=A0A0V0ZYT9_9BILA|nr:hypothetical protein T12_11259 [Trichinella patagoniensis]
MNDGAILQLEMYNRNSQTKSNCMQLTISIDAQPVITSAVKLGEVPMKFGKNFHTLIQSWELCREILLRQNLGHLRSSLNIRGFDYS